MNTRKQSLFEILLNSDFGLIAGFNLSITCACEGGGGGGGWWVPMAKPLTRLLVRVWSSILLLCST